MIEEKRLYAINVNLAGRSVKISFFQLGENLGQAEWGGGDTTGSPGLRSVQHTTLSKSQLLYRALFSSVKWVMDCHGFPPNVRVVKQVFLFSLE